MIFYGSSESHFIIKKMPDTAAGSEKAALPNVVRKDGALTIRSI